VEGGATKKGNGSQHSVLFGVGVIGEDSEEGYCRFGDAVEYLLAEGVGGGRKLTVTMPADSYTQIVTTKPDYRTQETESLREDGVRELNYNDSGTLHAFRKWKYLNISENKHDLIYPAKRCTPKTINDRNNDVA